MINNELLLQEIRESGLKLSYIAEKTGMSMMSLNRKINGETEFKVSEIIKISEILRLSDSLKVQIFLPGA